MTPSAAAATTHSYPDWTPTRRIGFRLTFSYLLLYNLPSPFYSIRGTLWIPDVFGTLWVPLVPWLGAHVMGIAGPIRNMGPHGDTVFAYVRAAACVFLSILATIAWTLLDRNRKQYVVLLGALRVYIRYTLAAALLVYGVSKVIPHSQLPQLTASRLFERVGNLNAQNVMWTFMRYSEGYACFTGTVEVLAGLLLFLRRTTVLGALVAFAAMTNVAAIDFFYHVPVRQYATHLLLMASFLVAPHFRRIVAVLLDAREIPPADKITTAPQSVWRRRGARIAQVAVAGALVFSTAAQSLEIRRRGSPQQPPLYGAYRVLEFKVNGQPMPLTGADAYVWQSAVFEGDTDYDAPAGYPRTGSTLTVTFVDDSTKHYHTAYDAAASMLTWFAGNTPNKENVVQYSWLNPEQLKLVGTSQKNSVQITMRKIAFRLNEPESWWLRPLR
jgi:hypothetical protein